MRVREDDSVDLADVGAQCLRPEIGSGIDDPGAFRRLHINGRPQSLVARIGRMTDCTIATNHRNSLGSAGAEEGDGELGALLVKAFGVEGFDLSWQASK